MILSNYFSELFRNPRMLTLITTYSCGAKCRHCLMNCSPDRTEKLSLSDIESSISLFKNACSGTGVVVFTGGECTLIGNDLFEAIAYTSSIGLLSRIVTNAWWASSNASTLSMLSELKSCGLSEINFSCDDYHAEFVPIENVRRAWAATDGMGFQTVGIAVCHDFSSSITPAFLQRYLDPGGRTPILRRMSGSESGTGMPPSRFIMDSGVTRIGRARNLELSQTIPNQELLLASSCPECGRDYVITPNNQFSPCCGINAARTWLFELGSATSRKCHIDSIQSTLLSYLRAIGPGGLLKHLRSTKSTREFGRKVYYSPCEICEDIGRSPDAKRILLQLIPQLSEELKAEKEFCQLISGEKQ